MLVSCLVCRAPWAVNDWGSEEIIQYMYFSFYCYVRYWHYYRLNSFLFEEVFENLRQKVPLGPADIRVFCVKFQNGKELLWAERESPKEPADPADSLNLRKSGNWVIKQTTQVMRVWSLLNGTDTVAAPSEGGTPASCFPSRGILRRYGNWQGTGWYMWAALWFPFLLGQLFPGWLQDVSPQSLFVWPKLSKANLNKEFYWRPPRNTYLLEKIVLVMQEMASFPLSQSWIDPAGQEDGGWSCRADSNRDIRAFPTQPSFRFKKGCQCLVQPTSQNVHMMSV